MNDKEADPNPFAPPAAELNIVRFLPAQVVDRRALLFAMVMATLSPAIFLVEEHVHPAITCACLVGPSLVAVFTQRGRWRLMGMVICSSYAFLGAIVGSFVYFTYLR